jgi:7-cyano-7-deazaguanine synthase
MALLAELLTHIRKQKPGAKRPKTTVLLSGGIDSTTCLAFYIRQRFQVAALFIDYGQAAAAKERHAARSISRHFHVPLRTIALEGVSSKGPGLVMGRNAFLLSTAALEFRAKAGIIGLGIHARTKYPDCSPSFVKKMQDILDAYTGGAVQIGAPFLSWTKAEIWTFANSQKVPLQLTYSCEKGLAQPCGLCASCSDLEALRARSLHKS